MSWLPLKGCIYRVQLPIDSKTGKPIGHLWRYRGGFTQRRAIVPPTALLSIELGTVFSDSANYKLKMLMGADVPLVTTLAGTGDYWDTSGTGITKLDPCFREAWGYLIEVTLSPILATTK